MRYSIGSTGRDEGSRGVSLEARGRRGGQGQVRGETRDKARGPGIGAVVPDESRDRMSEAQVGE